MSSNRVSWPRRGRHLLALGSVGLLCALSAGGTPSDASRVGAHVLASSPPLSSLEMRVKDNDSDEVLDESDLKEEDACEGEEAMAAVMRGEIKKLKDVNSPWVRFLSKLTEVKDSKQVCTIPQNSEYLCKLPTATEGSKGPPQLPCGGDEYMKLIGTFVHTKNCVLSLAVTQTLTQNWLGHSGNEGIFLKLIKQYESAMQFSGLDSELYYIYRDSAQLLKELTQSAKDGVAAFHSLEIKSVLLKRRRELTSLLCALGRGTEADTGSNVVVSDKVVVIRGQFSESENEALAAFRTAVDTFGVFVKGLLEEGGFLDRATAIHKELHKFRFSKLNALFSTIEPTTNEGDEALSLMKIIPVKHHKKRSPHKEEAAGAPAAAALGQASFLEGAMQDDPATAAPAAAVPVAPAPAAVAQAAAPPAAGDSLLVAVPVPHQQQQQQQQAAPAAPAATPQAAAAPAAAPAAPPPASAATPPAASAGAAPAPAVPGPAPTIFGASFEPPAPAATAPAASKAAPELAAAVHAAAPAAAPAAAVASAGAPSAPGVPAPHISGAHHEGSEESHKGVPIRQKVVAMASKLRMFEIHGEELGYNADVAALEKTIKAGYTDFTDKIYVVWAQLLPQAFTLTTFKFLALLMPSPVVDMAEFYNSTMGEDGTIKEGFVGEPPVNNKLMVERFSVAVDDAYKDSWRRFFAAADDLGLEAPKPNVNNAVQQHQEPPVSTLDAGIVRPHSFMTTGEEPEEFSVAIVSSADGLSLPDLEKFADAVAINKESVEALASRALSAMPNITGVASLAVACVFFALKP